MAHIENNTITLIQPDDWHLHLRDGAMLKQVVPDSARQFGRAIIMPNLKPPVTTTRQAQDYYQRIMQAQAGLARQLQPLMTLYLTDNTPAQEIYAAKESGLVYGVKLYPAGATTNSDAGVTDLLGNCSATLEALQEVGIPLLMHGEVTDPNIDIFDREAVFIDQVMRPLRKRFPELKVVFEHVTTAEGVAYVKSAEGPIGATITPQHLLYNRNAIFKGGLRPHWYCLPILKREKHRQALIDAATSGHERFFLGTDSAPHIQANKEQDCGCAGCYSARHALALYAEAFDKMQQIENLEAFTSLNGPKFYGLSPNTQTVTLKRQTNTIEQTIDFDDQCLVPLAAGQDLSWKFVEN